MSITLYSKYRRMKIRAAWELAGMAVWCKEVGKYIAAFVLALILVQYIADQAIAEDNAYEVANRAKTDAEKAEASWLSCLNHKGVWIDGVLHTCTIADTRLSRGDFK